MRSNKLAAVSWVIKTVVWVLLGNNNAPWFSIECDHKMNQIVDREGKMFEQNTVFRKAQQNTQFMYAQ
jgi:lipopolysaccharide export LptBFGC system permease protein LptF